MAEARFLTAAGTPLTDDDHLHIEGLERHLDDQAAAGIDGLLVAGTMGLMPLLSDQTWRDLVLHCSKLNCNRFELLVGISDQSTLRTLDRLAFINGVDGIDGVVALTPSAVIFTESQQIDYYLHLADQSRYPLFIYDLEPRTGIHLSVETVCRLAKHPNLAGIKLSSNVPEAARLRLYLGDSTFRIIIAEPVLSDMVIRHGFSEHLDGIYAVCPHWATALAEAARRDDWETAALWQRKLTAIKELFMSHWYWLHVFTVLMNERGIPGKFAPRPVELPTLSVVDQLRQLPIVQDLLESSKTGADCVRI